MAATFVKPGDTITVVCPSGGRTVGDSVLIGVSLFGVATHTAAAAADLELAVSGVWTLGKDTSLVISAGDRVYWDVPNLWVDKTLAAQTCVGIATTSAGSSDPTVEVLLGNTADLAGG